MYLFFFFLFFFSRSGSSVTLFVKASGRTVSDRVKCLSSGNWREVTFHTSGLALAAAPGGTVTHSGGSKITLHAEGSPWTGDYLIVSRDVRRCVRFFLIFFFFFKNSSARSSMLVRSISRGGFFVFFFFFKEYIYRNQHPNSRNLTPPFSFRSPPDGGAPDTVCGANMACGNQIWGVTETVPEVWADGTGLAVARAAYLRCAEMHARTWCDPRIVPQSFLEARVRHGGEPGALEQLDVASGTSRFDTGASSGSAAAVAAAAAADPRRYSFLKGFDWYAGGGRPRWERGINAARLAWRRGRGMLECAEGVTVSGKLLEVIERSLAAASWDAFQAHLVDAAVPWVLAHGDFHAANMAVGPRAEDMWWFDWSEVGPWEPMTDLAQMYISDIRADRGNADRGRELVRGYWEELGRRGVDTKVYTFERAYDDWCRGGAERWIWVFAILSSLPLPPAALQYFHDQLESFIFTHRPREVYVLKPCIAMVL
jgi:hypothetical protein